MAFVLMKILCRRQAY